MSFSIVRARRARLHFCVILGLLLGLVTTQISASTVRGAGIDQPRVLLPSGMILDGDADVKLIHDYGSFALYRVSAARLQDLKVRLGDRLEVVNDNEAIQFDGYRLDPHAPPAEILPLLQHGKNEGNGFDMQVVQFVGPITDPWLDLLRGTGVRIVQYIAPNSYVVLGNPQSLSRVAQLAGQGQAIQFTTPYAPQFKLNAPLVARFDAGLSADRDVAITLQLVSHPENGPSRGQIMRLSRVTGAEWWQSAGYENITITVRETDLISLSHIPDVFAIEEYVEPKMLDEVQSQILAGNLNVGQTGPSAPGYLAFLTSFGFSTNPADYPVVGITDGGVGNGSIVNGAGDPTLTLNGDGTTTRLLVARNCTGDANAGDQRGHGHINTSIVGGYDQRTGFPFVDANGYLRGQGMNPYARMVDTKIFNSSSPPLFVLTNCGGTVTTLAKREQDDGVQISSNSWGANVGGDYNANSQAYDASTRDADTTEALHQQMTFIFAAGNAGSGASTIGAPATAKNVITVGASENRRPTDESGAWTDGCGVPGTGADNAMDIIGFSSRGPAEGTRIKPEVIGPGTHINGTASTNTSYSGLSVCDQFRPGAQTVFAASSGTSHSTPAVSGMTSLIYRRLQTHHAIATPTPALLKAYLIAHPTYLTGTGANDTLPSNNQGYGMPNLTTAFDNTLRSFDNQATVFGASGNTFTWTGGVADNTKPVRIVMTFTDAPGSTTGSPVVNNLNLTVVNGANTYLGNRFTGAFSVTGGTADQFNNYEAVFLPAGTSGSLNVTITAAGISGDGVPGNADTTDQDFAFVCYNCSQTPDFSVDATPASQSVCVPTSAVFPVAVTPINGFASPVTLSATATPPGATVGFAPNPVTPPTGSTLTIGTAGATPGTYNMTVTGTSGALVRNDAASLSIFSGIPAAPTLSTPANGATGVSITPTLTWTAVSGAATYVLEIDDNPAFTSINYTVTVPGTSHTVATSLTALTTYSWRVRAQNTCGGTNSTVRTFTTQNLTCQTFSYGGPALVIPSTGTGGPGATTVSTVTSTLTGTITDVNVLNLGGTHTWINDLRFDLTSPAATTVIVMARSCNNEDNFGLNLDDSGTGPPPAWPCPPVGGGTFQPSNPLSGFNGQAANGTWTLTIADEVNLDSGFLNTWGVRICATTAAPVTAADDTASVNEDGNINQVAPGVLANDSGSGTLTTSLTTGATNGTATVASTGAFTYAPNGNYCGADSFVYTATNGSTSDPGTVNVTVNCVNDVPSFTKGADQTVLEDAAAQTVLGWATALSRGPANESAQTLSFNITANSNPGLFSVAPAVAANGTLTYTPAAHANGSATITLNIQDSGGTANGGVDTSATQTFIINVTAVNDAPSFTKGADQTVNEDAGAQTAVGWATLISTGPANESGQAITGFNITGNTNAALFSVAPAVAANGTLTYTPAAHANGSSTITLNIQDNGGIANSGVDTSAAQTFVINVTAVNDAPSYIKGADPTVNEDAGAQSVPAWATAISAGPNEAGQILTFNVTANNNPTLFSSGPAVASNGTLTYTPAANASGTATITLALSDNGGIANGGVDTSVGQTFVITVNSSNDAPSFIKGVDQTVNEDAGAQSVPTWATSISSGPANESGQTVTFNVTNNTNPALFAVVPAVSPTGTLSYTPAANANGSATITLILQDNGGIANSGSDTSAPQSFVINITPVNDPPVAAAESIAVNQGQTATALVGGATSLLTNDSDIDVGDVLSVNLLPVTPPTRGALTLNANGSFSYVHDNSTFTTDSFVYRVCDNATPQACDTETVSISINRTPTVTCNLADQLYVEGEVVNLNLSTMFSDPEATTMSYAATGLPASLSVNSSSGLLSGTLSLTDNVGSPYAVTLNATDAGNAVGSQSVNFVVLDSGEAIFRNGFDDPSAPAVCQ